MVLVEGPLDPAFFTVQPFPFVFFRPVHSNNVPRHGGPVLSTGRKWFTTWRRHIAERLKSHTVDGENPFTNLLGW